VDGWVDASDDRAGMALIPIDMPLVSIGNIGIFTFEPERVPTEPIIYSHLFNTQWGTNFRQWHEGDFTFRVRLLPHAGDWRHARLWETALHDFGFAAGSRQIQNPKSKIQNQQIRLSDGLVLLSLRPRHDGAGLVVRFWDALGLPREVRVDLDGPVAAVWRCDLMERPLERLALERGDAEGASHTRLELSIAPHAVETLLVEFG
jgi:alpha-mannosidase